VLTTPHHKTGFVTNCEHLPLTGTQTAVRPKEWEREMRFDTWNVGSLYSSSKGVSKISGMWVYGLDRAVQDRDRWRTVVSAVMNLRVP